MTDEIVVPDYIEPITAYRCWGLKGTRLESATIPYEWKPGPNTAECFIRDGTIPHDASEGILSRRIGASPFAFTCDRTCGFYSKNTQAGMWFYRNRFGDQPMVMGEIKIWGKVIPGQRGYRSQYAEISALYANRVNAKRIAKIASIYGVPVKKLHWWQVIRPFSWGYFWTLWIILSVVNMVSIFAPSLMPLPGGIIPALLIIFGIGYALKVITSIIGKPKLPKWRR